MTVMEVLLKKLMPGMQLRTPVMGSKFLVGDVSPTGVTLILGRGWKTPIPAEYWNGIPTFLRGRDWVEIGAVHGASKPGTLENYIDGFITGSAGNYVAAVLEQVGIVEIDRQRPSKIRLRSSDAGRM
jgi:hypothetical protein